MEIFSKLGSGTGKMVLRKMLKTRKRHKKVFNLKTARSIGILFDATNINHFEAVYELYKDLLKDHEEIFVLGFVNANDIPDQYLFKKNFSFFTKKEVNWYFKPKNQDALRFTDKRYDILINLNLTYNLLFDFIIALSLARFKVGRYCREENYYDFMISIEKEPTFEYFIQQVKHYLEMINRPELSTNFINV